ncbi:hypothetical protein OEZ85_009613 [Tetradesmus obliquus]|uniref:PsbP C-terminal domain-containing protein n=1 Tax=Tetradesmus obliquus TaxID=3088 RepID=A0ABY8UCM9_TETOB|nr:hypothetical protein OEZ85_009613 [Tetradesmus obliquus]
MRCALPQNARAFGSTTTSSTKFSSGPRPAAITTRAANSNSEIDVTSRRDCLLELSSLAVGLAAWGLAPAAATAGPPPQVPMVGTYLPPAGVDDLVLFVPDSKKTPAIRAGTVNPDSPYRFALPPKFREGKVANILSGNYCQPRCDEPWTEVIFESSTEGRIAVIVSPLVKLTRQKDARIEDVGTPQGILNSLGSYITGTYIEEDDVVSATSKQQEDGRTYYYYELNAPYGTLGPHSYSACTTKGDIALLFIASANEKQWANSKDALRKAAETFRA